MTLGTATAKNFAYSSGKPLGRTVQRRPDSGVLPGCAWRVGPARGSGAADTQRTPRQQGRAAPGEGLERAGLSALASGRDRDEPQIRWCWQDHSLARHRRRFQRVSASCRAAARSAPGTDRATPQGAQPSRHDPETSGGVRSGARPQRGQGAGSPPVSWTVRGGGWRGHGRSHKKLVVETPHFSTRRKEP